MSTITPIEGRSVHQIQSGQVIVDLCSVAKELVENSLDSGATSIDVRFRNHGIDSIEVQDNGAGILPEDYATVALKHYTSKLSTYDDLSNLQTFGFRGEALSSMCALSHFHIVTARESEAPRGKKLDFETSGTLKSSTIAACPRGTTVAVESLFNNLPVRKRELEKNIKREYGKVLNVLYAYACISTGVRISVSNQTTKGKKLVVFTTNANPNTAQNISNVFGAKTLLALIPMSLDLELQPSGTQITSAEAASRELCLEGHISRPILGEGRQTPDRQMFFVNSRPCALPQVAKAFNEVYKSYNLTQSPFIFANLKMDTNSYDVNVSPDKRTILLHDQTALLENLKASLHQLFEAQDQTVPQSQFPGPNLPAFQPLTINSSNNAPTAIEESAAPYDEPSRQDRDNHVHSTGREDLSSSSPYVRPDDERTVSLAQKFATRNAKDREAVAASATRKAAFLGRNDAEDPQERQSQPLELENDTYISDSTPVMDISSQDLPRPVRDFNERLASQDAKRGNSNAKPSIVDSPNDPIEIPTITPGSKNTSQNQISSAFDRMNAKRRRIDSSSPGDQMPVTSTRLSNFVKRMHVYAAPGTQSDKTDEENNDDEDDNDIQSVDADDDFEGKPLHRNESALRSETQISTDDEVGGVDEKSVLAVDEDSDSEYIEEEERKKRDQAKVEEMVRRAEEAAAKPSEKQMRRTENLLQSGTHKDSTYSLVRILETSCQNISQQLLKLTKAMELQTDKMLAAKTAGTEPPESSKASVEERLSLTIAKSDFARMRIIGQFNLGFILATRPPSISTAAAAKNLSDDLFIIDQHASDEIYNFSLLSQTTTLTPQRLVRPYLLELTAVEEETIIHHSDALARNGFTVAVDQSGDSPVGRRCQLLTLPTSRETVFDMRDLEELIALLGDTPPPSSASAAAARGATGLGDGSDVPRPGRVRRMLAMRACRSSIMVGKPLTAAGMATVVRHMGEIDRPWNCPHGRPTMRHLAGLDDWRGWDEGDGLVSDYEQEGGAGGRDETDWWTYLQRAREEGIADQTQDGSASEEGSSDDNEEEDGERAQGVEDNSGEEEEKEEEEEEAGNLGDDARERNKGLCGEEKTRVKTN